MNNWQTDSFYHNQRKLAEMLPKLFNSHNQKCIKTQNSWLGFCWGDAGCILLEGPPHQPQVESWHYLKVSRVLEPGHHSSPRPQLQLVQLVYHELLPAPVPGLGLGGRCVPEGDALPTCHTGQHWADWLFSQLAVSAGGGWREARWSLQPVAVLLLLLLISRLQPRDTTHTMWAEPHISFSWEEGSNYDEENQLEDYW